VLTSDAAASVQVMIDLSAGLADGERLLPGGMLDP
jgi:hypothetical protein